MKKIGQGRTAEVFDLENGRVVKLLLPGFPEKELQEELHCAQEVGQFDLPAPKCYGIVEMDGRKGLVYDLAAGESLRRHMLRTGEIEGDMARMAQAHRRILGCAYSGGKDIRKWLRWQTERSELLEDTLKKRALEVMDALPDGNALLHGEGFFPEEVTNIYDEYEKNLSRIIDEIKNMNPDAYIIVQTVYNPFLKQTLNFSYINVGKTANRYVTRLNDSIKNVCKTKNRVFVFDVAPEMNEDAENFYGTDEKLDIHPTKHGHATLARVFTEKFNGLLKD